MGEASPNLGLSPMDAASPANFPPNSLPTRPAAQGIGLLRPTCAVWLGKLGCTVL
jgi:hypothetical protein